MKPVLHLESIFNQFVIDHFYETGVKPNSLEVSPGFYRQLMEMRSAELSPQETMVGCSALEEVSTPIGRLRVVINERLNDIEFACA